MVRHDFHFEDVRLMLGTNLLYYLSQPCCYLFGKHLASVLGTPNEVVFTGVDDIVVGFEVSIPHVDVIPQGAI